MGGRNDQQHFASYPADAHDLDSYGQAAAAQSQLRMPVLLRADNPHERLYVAALDGTGNSMFRDKPDNWSVVAKIHTQIDDLKKQGITNISSGYVEGTFTQDNPITRIRDGITGHTFDQRVETAYYQFCQQAKKWIDEDPNAQIRIAGVGFSRGAEEVAALTRMIHERGIQDPTDANLTRNKDNLITRIEYADKPLLVPPGQTLQAALLYDPVSTGVKEHDRRLPPSVVSALQITAEDERRDQFRSTNLLQPGFSEDHRFLNVTVGGSHSDIGDTYLRNGIGVRSGNLGVAFLNGLSDRPFLEPRAVPEDPAMSVVHRSERHLYRLYTQSGFRDGVRDRLDVLCQPGPARDCVLKEPVDPALEAGLLRRTVSGAAAPAVPERSDVRSPPIEIAPQQQSRFFPRTAADDYVEGFLAATERGDHAARQALTQQYEQLPQVQALQQDARDALAAERQRALEEEQRRQAQEREWLMQQQASEQQERSRGHARSM